MKEGDRNTKFFHKMTSCKQSSNVIFRLLVGGRWVEREDQIRLEVERHFRNLFFEDGGLGRGWLAFCFQTSLRIKGLVRKAA